MKKPLTDKERAILEFVISATRLNGYPPSVRDICAETGIKSTSTVFSYIKRLEEKGYLEKEDGKSRSIRTKADPAERNSIRVPLLGDVAAGLPILASEDLSGEEYIDFTPSGGSASSFGGRLFALRIRGTSMIEAGILDGDIVVVERTPIADDGDMYREIFADLRGIDIDMDDLGPGGNLAGRGHRAVPYPGPRHDDEIGVPHGFVGRGAAVGPEHAEI